MNHIRIHFGIFCLFLHILCADIHSSNLWLPSIFGDNMVLQRNNEVVFWGKAERLSKVTVCALGKNEACVANENGEWKVSISLTNETNTPFVVKIKSGNDSILYRNVILGDIWLASGQSNMELKMIDVTNARDEMSKANHPEIRFFNVATSVSRYPLDDVSGKWEICSPSSISRLSGVAYYFALSLLENQHTPVGIISSSWGGTPIEAWTSHDMLKLHPDFYHDVIQIEKDTVDWLHRYNEYRKEWKVVRNSNQGLEKRVHTPDYDDSAWKEVRYPMTVWNMGLGYYGGFLWLRKHFTWDDCNKDTLHLQLGNIYGEAEIFLNGKFMGTCNNPLNDAHYVINKRDLRSGDNMIAVRLCSFWGTGKIGEKGQTARITDANGNVTCSLDSKWLMAADIESPFPKSPGYSQNPGALYNAMIHPFRFYTLKGILWYQGENNASRATQYRQLFPMMIYDWRVHFAQGSLPFLFVQLANYKKPESFQFEDDWAYLRDAQFNALRIKNTGMATIIDAGSIQDIHPKDKKTVGTRLYAQAASLVYGDKTIATGPLYEHYEIEGEKVKVYFSNPHSVLTTSDGKKPAGFYISGEDRCFYPADEVQIDGNVVVLCSEKVSKPVSVRYAWASNPLCNVCNTTGIPLSPFRLDNWDEP